MAWQVKGPIPLARLAEAIRRGRTRTPMRVAYLGTGPIAWEESATSCMSHTRRFSALLPIVPCRPRHRWTGLELSQVSPEPPKEGQCRTRRARCRRRICWGDSSESYPGAHGAIQGYCPICSLLVESLKTFHSTYGCGNITRKLTLAILLEIACG